MKILVDNIFRNIQKNGMIKDIFLVISGNVALLFSKVIVWLIVPKMLGVTEYGYYKIFTLYLGYAMLLHFGFPDGILLLYGGKEYGELDKSEFRLYSHFQIVFLGAISVIVIIAGIFVAQGIYRFIFCMLGVDAFFMNWSTYFKFLSQATMRFNDVSKCNFIAALLQVLFVGGMFFLSRLQIIRADGWTYILGIVLIDLIILIWYTSQYKDIIWGKAAHICWKSIRKVFQAGIILTMAAQVAHLVFILDRQMVSLLFDIDTYSFYSFAYSAVNMVTVTISAIATVIFPRLKKVNTERAMEQYSILLSGITSIVFLLLAGYYPLAYFIQWFLPEYTDALQYIEIILPGLAISSCINIVIFTYYKVINQLTRYMFIALCVLMIGLILNCSGYFLLGTPVAFAIASIITMLIWYLLAQRYVLKNYAIKKNGNFCYICVLLLWFYFVTYLFANKVLIAMLLYLVGYIVISFGRYRLAHNK